MIWCVDDDNAIRDIEVYTLESTGFQALGFADGSSMLESLKQMVAAGRAAGVPCSITDSYRSIYVQQYLWDRRKTAYMEEGYDAATADMMTGWSVAIPGHSEHHTGLCVDLVEKRAHRCGIRATATAESEIPD